MRIYELKLLAFVYLYGRGRLERRFNDIERLERLLQKVQQSRANAHIPRGVAHSEKVRVRLRHGEALQLNHGVQISLFRQLVVHSFVLGLVERLDSYRWENEVCVAHFVLGC